jgi:hypothetical protein
VTEGADLLPYTLHDLGMTVTEGSGQDATEAVQELPAFRVYNPYALATHENEWCLVVRPRAREQVLLMTRAHCVRIDPKCR